RAVDLDHDEPPRPSSTLDGLAALRTVNGSSTVTAGNAPDLSTGATALVLGAEGEGTPLAYLRGFSAAAGHPQHIASMPAVAGGAPPPGVGQGRTHPGGHRGHRDQRGVRRRAARHHPRPRRR